MTDELEDQLKLEREACANRAWTFLRENRNSGLLADEVRRVILGGSDAPDPLQKMTEARNEFRDAVGTLAHRMGFLERVLRDCARDIQAEFPAWARDIRELVGP